MYYSENKLRGLGIGVKAKVSFPPEIKEAAASFPAFRAEFGRATTTAEKLQTYLPYVYLGTAALVIWIVMMKGVDKK